MIVKCSRGPILILGGTTEARHLAEHLASIALPTITSLAGRTNKPVPLPGQIRRGGFGGAAGLAKFVREHGVSAVIDATHPFAARISRNAHAACVATRTPRLRLWRPPWVARPGDHWIEAATIEAAARATPEHGKRIFLTTGRQDLARFASPAEVRFLVRLVEPPGGPLPLVGATLVIGRGPFAEQDEIRLMKAHRIDLLVAKNSGGEPTYAKITAARALGLPVLMIRRPAVPAGPNTSSLPTAIRWLTHAPLRGRNRWA